MDGSDRVQLDDPREGSFSSLIGRLRTRFFTQIFRKNYRKYQLFVAQLDYFIFFKILYHLSIKMFLWLASLEAQWPDKHIGGARPKATMLRPRRSNPLSQRRVTASTHVRTKTRTRLKNLIEVSAFPDAQIRHCEARSRLWPPDGARTARSTKLLTRERDTWIHE